MKRVSIFPNKYPVFMAKNDGDVINLREDEPEFKIGHVENERPIFKSTPTMPNDSNDQPKEPDNKVKVKFEKFVNLIANHAFEDVIDKHAHQEIIISTDLLTDLANASEDKSGPKWLLVLILGIVIGGAFVFYFAK